jgi:secreted Zn-dependent insulinase-like peptidase
VIDDNFLKRSTPLLDVETPTFRSMKLPTRSEAASIFGTVDKSIPLVYQDVAYSESEENNAVELVLQAGCDHELGYEGVAILELISHMAYNSAFNKLRTEEQLGYIVSSGSRKSAGGSWALSTVVQSSVAEPSVLEERIEAWLVSFREELQQMHPEAIATEAAAVVAQLLERDTKLSQEVGRVWTEIMLTETLSDQLKEPSFDRLELLAEELIVNDNGSQSAVELKQKVLNFFDKYFAADSPERRAMSSRVYSQKNKAAYEEGVSKPGILSDYADIFHLKQFLSTWPVAPYFLKKACAER